MARAKHGFALIELLVVVGILGLLAGIVLVSLGGAREDAQIAKARAEISHIERAILMLELHTAEWPGHQPPGQACSPCANPENEIPDPPSGGGVLVPSLNEPEAGITQNDGGQPFPNWNGPYMSQVPADPWGNPYFFDTDYHVDASDNPCSLGAPPCLVVAALGSFGPDGIGTNAYNADDIIRILAR